MFAQNLCPKISTILAAQDIQSYAKMFEKAQAVVAQMKPEEMQVSEKQHNKRKRNGIELEENSKHERIPSHLKA